jgi:RNA polymerase sigma-70 factor (ECF subfamily)
VKPGADPAPSKGWMEPVPRESQAREGGPSPESAVRDLVARAQGGDESAFRALVVLHQDRAYGLALRIVRSPADAEEVAQDAFVRAWSALPRFRGESRFGTWLHRIVARRALDRVAELKRRGGRELHVADEAALPEPAEAGHDPGETLRKRAVERRVAALPPTQRTVVTLYYYEDKSVEQVATILGMPENTVKTHLSRARAALREALEGETP